MLFQQDRKPAHIFKLCLIGNRRAKKSIEKSLCFDIFDADTKLTIGIDFYTYDMPIIKNSKSNFIRFSIWDFGGQEQFNKMSSYYLHGANGILFIFSLEDPIIALGGLDWWMERIQKVLSEDIPKMIVGCKSDAVKNNIEANNSLMKPLIKKYKNIPYFIISLNDSLNIRKIFEDMAKTLLDKNKFDYDRIL